MKTITKKLKILIVDDALDILELLNYTLSSHYQTLTAVDGESALTISLHEKPDLIVLDINLPDISGFDVLERLKKNRTTRDIPVIFLTERTDVDSEIFGLKLGALDFITKPVIPAVVTARVNAAIRPIIHFAWMQKVIDGLLAINDSLEQDLISERARIADLSDKLSSTEPEFISMSQKNEALMEKIRLMQDKVSSLERGLRAELKEEQDKTFKKD